METLSITGQKFSNCPKNGSDRLVKGNLRRRHNLACITYLSWSLHEKNISITTSLLPLSTLMSSLLFICFLFSKINAYHGNQAGTSTTGGSREEKADETETPIATNEKFARDEQIEREIRSDECSVEAGKGSQEFEVPLPAGGYLQYTTELKCAMQLFIFDGNFKCKVN